MKKSHHTKSFNLYLIPVVILILICNLSCQSSRHIISKPIIFDDTRTSLTLEYLEDHYGISKKDPTIIPKIIVLHWTEIPTFEKTFEAFNPSLLPNHRSSIKSASSLNVSSQFIVDQDGSIYQLMPDNYMARHVIGLNHCAIGIENVGGTEDLPLTRAQVKSNAYLVEYLKEKYDIEYLIGHFEYTNFENHELWLEKNDGYRTVKNDPGEEFLEAVKDQVKHLNIKSAPSK